MISINNTHSPVFTNTTQWRRSLLVDGIMVSILTTLLLATVLMAGILQIYYSQRPDYQMNVLVLLRSQMVHALLAINVTSILPALTWSAGFKVPHIGAELVSMLIVALASQLVITTVANSSSRCSL